MLQFEKRVPFRRALRKVMRSYRRAHLHNVEGIKIQISGRINGAEIARTEWTRKGRVPLHTLQADIDYSSKSAKTIYGLLGVKIWVFRGITNTKMRTPFPNKILRKFPVIDIDIEKIKNFYFLYLMFFWSWVYYILLKQNRHKRKRKYRSKIKKR